MIQIVWMLFESLNLTQKVKMGFDSLNLIQIRRFGIFEHDSNIGNAIWINELKITVVDFGLINLIQIGEVAFESFNRIQMVGIVLGSLNVIKIDIIAFEHSSHISIWIMKQRERSPIWTTEHSSGLVKLN